MFGVSRSSLRQALKVLEIMGVVTQQVSRGTYLSDNASAILAEPIDFLVLLDGISHHELFEARMMLEPELAARAAERATTDDLRALRGALTQMRRALSDQMRYIEGDVAFHDAVFAAAGNRVCQAMMRVVQRAVLTSIARTSGLTELERSFAFHKAIYVAIEKRRPDEARQEMIQHLKFGRDRLLLATQKPAVGLAEKIAAMRAAL